MKSPPCCVASKPGRRSGAPPMRRGAEVAGFLLSGATLVLMPKCPMCVAGWVALFTGASVSVAAASHLRTAALILCSAILLALGWKTLCSLLRDSRR